MHLDARGIATGRAMPAWERQAAMRAPTESKPAPLLLAYASQTGVAEHYARDTTARLLRADVAVRLLAFDALTLPLLAASPRVLLVVSTTYDGEPPDAADAFREHMQAPAALGHLHYGLLSLGDRCYPRFCAFGRELHAWLQASGATASFEPVEVDDEDPAALRAWHRRVLGWVAERVTDA